MRKQILIIICIIVLGIIIGVNVTEKKESAVVSNLNITNIKDTIPKVALTFDDGPSSRYTEKLLDGLKERDVKATFFVMGESVSENSEIIKRMYEDGHLIGNHTYTHADLAKTDFNTACREINETNSCISNITGYTPKYIRPPYGDWDQRLLEETDMSVVLWTIDPEDWKDQNAGIVASRVLKSVRSGDIILLHDIFKSSVDAALIIIDKLQDKGYHFVTVDKINNKKIINNQETKETKK
ncbi:MAG: polysaccharide deacetylase family protein [Eubacterium sp.]